MLGDAFFEEDGDVGDGGFAMAMGDGPDADGEAAGGAFFGGTLVEGGGVQGERIGEGGGDEEGEEDGGVHCWGYGGVF